MRIRRLTSILMGALLLFTLLDANVIARNSSHVIASLPQDLSLRDRTFASLSVNSAAEAISDWLCTPVYAADKGAAPMAHWRFDEAGGPTAYDESANNNDGTLAAGAGGTNTAVGQMWSRQGKIGGALELDGTDDTVTLPTTISFNASTSYTVELWFKQVGNTGTQIIFATSGGGPGDITLGVVSGVLGYEYGGRYADTSTGQTITTGQWYHAAITWDTVSNIKVYLNGVQVASKTDARDYGGTWHRLGTTYPGNINYFNGLIDDTRIYNYERTADQVLVDYNAGSAAHLGAGADPNEGNPPVGYWPLDENTGTTAYDRSGTGNNGTITNATWAAGKHGSALSLDGTGDYVDAGDNASIAAITGDLTIEAWLKKTSSGGDTTLVSTHYGKNDFTRPYDLLIFDSSGDDPMLRLGNGTAQFTAASSERVNINQWYHIAGTVEGASMKIYVNGVEKGSATFSGTRQTGTKLTIGSSALGDSRNFTGLIDDVKIYNYARTPAQIAYDYNKGKPVAQYKFDEGAGAIAKNEYSTADAGAAPIGWWRMDESAWNGTANEVADSSGKGNHGVRVGTATTSSSSKIGPYAGTFNGTGDYVNLGATTNFNFIGTSDFTFSAWAYETALPPPAGAAHILFNIYQDANNSYQIGILDHSDSNLDGFYLRSARAGTTKYFSDRNLSGITGGWRFLTVVYSDATQSATLYVNGVAVTTYTYAAEVIGIGAAKYIGSRGSDYHWNGRLDDTRIYNYARTSEQIYNDYITTHGTLVGDTKFVDGKIGKALQFDGTGDYVDCGTGANLSFSGPFTMGAWVKFNSVSGVRLVLHKEYVNIALFNNDFMFAVSGVENAPAAGITPEVNRWYYIAGVNDGSSRKIYVDGVLKGTSNTNANYNLGSSSRSFVIGRSNYASETYFLDGFIDDVRIYNYARTAEQIMQDYTQGAARLGAPSAGEADPWGGALPVAHWKMDENTGVLANDASGNRNNGTLTNGPTWVQGKVGPALSFDGGDDTISIPSIISSYPFTVSLWATHDLGWNPAGSSSTMDELLNLSIAGQRVSLGISDGWDANGEITLMYGGTSHWGAGKPTATGPNDWHHITWVVYGSNNTNHKVYIDGVVQTMTDRLGAHGGVAGWNIGNNSQGSEGWAGKIDDIKIYNYTRTPAQVTWDYNRGKPTGHWRMNEATSGSAVGTGTIKDDSGRGNHGTGSGTNLAWTTGKFGGALSFNGTNDLVNCGQVMNTDKTLPFTMSAWVNQTDASGWRTIIGNNVSYAEIAVSGGTVYFGQNAGGGWFMSAGTISASAWHHIAGVYDGTNASVYVDGVLKAGPSARSFTNASHGVSLIGSYAPGGGELFSGKIDDARIYNYARTAEQIMQDYLNGASARLGD